MLVDLSRLKSKRLSKRQKHSRNSHLSSYSSGQRFVAIQERLKCWVEKYSNTLVIQHGKHCIEILSRTDRGSIALKRRSIQS